MALGKRSIWKSAGLFLLFFLITASHQVHAQYFGRNKVKYTDPNYRVYQTPHFDIYHYLENPAVRDRFAIQAEQWYQLHQRILGDTFKSRNPIILYSNHADFQQTSTVQGEIGVGTGGVTEALKNRVVMPVMETNAQTGHVLGHELVHAFQYNLMRTGDSTSLYSIGHVPLWMVEGLAEYMSLGSVDAHTALWMRDAVISKDIPSLEDLTRNPKYFPYRYGQAFWAYVGATYGDDKILPLFIESAEKGYPDALKLVLGITEKEFSANWKNALQTYYEPYLATNNEPPAGQKIISEKNAGEMNMSPVISPDGRFIVFISEKDLFTLDLFLADAKTGKFIKKISTASRDDHIDALSFTGSSGAWSPDSRRFAYVVFAGGKNKLVITDVLKRRSDVDFEIPEVPSFSYPAWSPDGSQIAVSGLVNGQTDLYVYNLNTGITKQLTNDLYSEIHPSWSADGKKLAFVTDRDAQNPDAYQIGVLDIEARDIKLIDVFKKAKNLNPHMDASGNIYFLSDRDGFRNLYRYEPSGNVYQLTNYYTGITGLAELSKAYSISDEGQLAYSYYLNHQYHIYNTPIAALDKKQVPADSVDFKAAALPPFPATALTVVNANISQINNLNVSAEEFRNVPYRPRFKLDHIGNSGLGVSANRFGSGISGGVNMLFSDILGNNMLFAGIAINGELADIAGQAAYLNQAKRINYGGSFSHIPYRSAQYFIVPDTLESENNQPVPVDNLVIDLLRIFEDKIELFTWYPFSTVKRLEFGGAFTMYSYGLERLHNYYFEGSKVGEKKEKLEAPENFHVTQLNTAYVGDNSFFGITSPLRGYRYRFQAEQYIDGVNVFNLLADYRQYKYLRPTALAMRILHYARFGRDSENLTPLFLGYPTLVRGYEAASFYTHQQIGDEVLTVNQLTGSRILVSNLEIRLPFTGPRRLALIKSGLLFTELAGFLDGGLAWTQKSRPVWTLDPDKPGEQRFPVFSTGLTMRINVFGALILETYYAFPLQRDNVSSGVFGLNFSPGF